MDEALVKKAQKEMDKAKYNLITKAEHTFIMNIMFAMRFVWTDEVPTAATDGRHIYTNPDFFLKGSQQFQQFILIHETYHVVFKHVCRGKAMPHLDQKRMNCAEDYMINLLIDDVMGYHPEECLFDEQYRGMSSMEIYHLLPADIEPPGGPDVLALALPGEGVADGEGTAGDQVTQEDIDALAANIDQMVIAAAIHHEKKTGLGPGGTGTGSSLERYIEAMTNPAINWLPLARKHMTAHIGNTMSMRKPNRRWLPHKMIMASRSGKGMNDVAVYLDSSGSVTPNELNEYLAFVRHMHTSIKPHTTHIASFDHLLHPGGKYPRSARIPSLTLEGGGGTDIYNVMDDAAEIEPKLVVVFTDGHFHPPLQSSVPYDLLWIILDNPKFTCHIGKVIHHTTK